MEAVAFLAIFIVYVAALVAYFFNFENPAVSMTRWGQRLIQLGLALHAVFIVHLSAQSKICPLLNIQDSLYVASFLIILASYIIERRYHAGYLVLFSLPVSLILSLLAAILSKNPSLTLIAPSSRWTAVHAALIVIGFVSLIIAVSSAVMYLIQSHQLKSKHVGRTFLKLPSLTTLDQIHFVSLIWGVILFSFGLLSGVFSAKNSSELKEVLRDPKVVLSLVACGMYWLILSFRLSQLRRGQKIAAGTVVVFALLAVTLLTANYGPYGFHRGL